MHPGGSGSPFGQRDIALQVILWQAEEAVLAELL
jgi:hypothetical protein